MPLFKDSYETTVGSVLDTKRIVSSIKECMIREPLESVNLNVISQGNFTPVYITGTFPFEGEVPLFTHPITILNNNKGNYLCTDLRFYVKKDAPLDNIQSAIKNVTEFNFAKSRSMLSLLWLDHGQDRLRIDLSFAGLVFSEWLSEVLSKAFALDFKDKTVLNILSHFYYQSLFTEKTQFDEDDKQRMASSIIKATKAPSALVFEVIDKIDTIASIEDYVRLAISILENVRIKNLSLATLLTLIGSSWYGNDAKKVLQVAIEHPPTWCAIVHASLSERTYKTSNIYRIAERFGKRGASDEFMGNYAVIIKGMLKPTEANVRTISEF
jgi:hypothetical protein